MIHHIKLQAGYSFPTPDFDFYLKLLRHVIFIRRIDGLPCVLGNLRKRNLRWKIVPCAGY